MKYYILSLVCFSLSGCWLGNSFSQNCDPTICDGICTDNICVLDSSTPDVAGDTKSKPDVGVVDLSDIDSDTSDLPKVACSFHTDCDQTIDFEGEELCVSGFCEKLIFEEGQGRCNEITMGKDIKLALDHDSTNSIIIPVVSSITGAASGVNPDQANNGYRLAAKHANQSNALGQRKVILVMCDDNTDPIISKKIGARLVKILKPEVYVGSNFIGGLSSDVAVPRIADDKLLTFINSTDIDYTRLPDELSFRNLPSESLAVRAIVDLAVRYNPASIGIFVQNGNEVFTTENDALRANLSAKSNAEIKVGRFDRNQYTTAVNALTTAGNNPVDFLIGIGEPKQIVAAIDAYKSQLGANFANSPPRIVVPTILGPKVVEKIIGIDSSLTPFNVEMAAGAANSTEAFKNLYQTDYAIRNDIAPSLYDSLSVILLAYAAGGKTSEELRNIIRDKFTNSRDPNYPDRIGDTNEAIPVTGPDKFSTAANALRAGKTIHYVGAAGGDFIGVNYNQEGDVEYPRIIGTIFTDGGDFRPTRFFFESTSIDLCDPGLLGGSCPTTYTDSKWDQQCTPSFRPDFGFCLPKCDVGTCPDGLFCGGDGLCRPATLRPL